MIVIKTLKMEEAGRVMEGPNQGNIVIRPSSEINITLSTRQLKKILVDLGDLDPSRINQTTEMFVAKLQAADSC